MKKIFALASCAFLFVALTIFISAPPSAHAATHAAAQPTCNGPVGEGTVTHVYDSYGTTLEGYVVVMHNDCNNYTWARFLGNGNGWKSITLYIELTYTPGYIQGGPWQYQYSHIWDTLAYSDWNTCYYAEIDLLDYRNVDNWYGTPSWCSPA